MGELAETEVRFAAHNGLKSDIAPCPFCVHETDMPKYLGDVRCWVNSGKHLLSLSFSGFDPGRVETFFDPQKLHATGRDGPRRDRLSLFLLYRVWSQSGRNLKPC
jgi:hypothetical protein